MSTQLGIVVADFDTQTSQKVAAGDTSVVLQSILDDDGVALPDGVYFFNIDGTLNIKEHFVGTLTASTKTLSSIKTISRQGVRVTGFARPHKVGAAIKLTDFATLYILNEMVKGNVSFDGSKPITYDSHPTFTLPTQLIDKKYADDIIVGLVGNATNLAFGTVKLSVAATDVSNPIVVGDNDPRLAGASSLNALLTQDGASNGTDQSQLTQNATVTLGEADATTKHNKLAQSFVAGKTSIVGASLYKSANTGTFTGTVTISLQADTAGSPSGSSLATVTISNADYLALPVGEFSAIFASPYTATIGTTYWIVETTSTSDNSNHPNLGTNSAGGYSSGSVKFNNTTDGWTAISTIDLYFRILTTNLSKTVQSDSNGFIKAYAPYATDSGSTDAYEISIAGITAYVKGMTIVYQAATANNGAATINLNNLGAKAIKKNVSVALETGDILATQMLILTYDGVNFQLGTGGVATSSLNKYNSGAVACSVTGSGNQTIAHGLGKIPKVIKITATEVAFAFYWTSIGTYDGTNISTLFNPNNGSSGASPLAPVIDTTHLVYIQPNNSTNITADPTMDATNITLAWGNGATGVKLFWEAWA